MCVLISDGLVAMMFFFPFLFFFRNFSLFLPSSFQSQIVPQNHHPSVATPIDDDDDDDETNKKKEERRRQDLNLRTRCVFDF